ncbi:MAG: Ku protein [Candidatus Dormibacteria bacterium]
MPRSMWRGAISFGMVAIPVRLYLATESKGVSFRLLCPEDHEPIKNRRWCPRENREIGWNEAVRGFEVGKDEYLVIEDRELDDLPLATAHTIEIVEFCSDAEIEAGVYVKGAYYLEPEAVGVKPYHLLRTALEKTGKVAIGKIALRDREHLCRLALHEHGLLLNTLHWPDEIRRAEELSLPETDVKLHDRELDMAMMLIDNLTASFDPSRYRDGYRDALLQLVEAKLENRPLEKRAPAPAQASDLMAALKASVEASRGSRSTGEGHDRPLAHQVNGQAAAEEAQPAPRRKAS